MPQQRRPGMGNLRPSILVPGGALQWRGVCFAAPPPLRSCPQSGRKDTTDRREACHTACHLQRRTDGDAEPGGRLLYFRPVNGSQNVDRTCRQGSLPGQRARTLYDGIRSGRLVRPFPIFTRSILCPPKSLSRNHHDLANRPQAGTSPVTLYLPYRYLVSIRKRRIYTASFSYGK
ncbi:MAG: hypothetical protein PWP34_83 [Desulfuromonadales bacterium]|nr:hypothetical protein [Desulfuromonadales bacterium]